MAESDPKESSSNIVVTVVSPNCREALDIFCELTATNPSSVVSRFTVTVESIDPPPFRLVPAVTDTPVWSMWSLAS